MDADRAKVRPQVVLLCQLVCCPDYCLPFEAPDMLLASLVLGMTLVGHDMGSAQHTRCSSRGPGGICWSFMAFILSIRPGTWLTAGSAGAGEHAAAS